MSHRRLRVNNLYTMIFGGIVGVSCALFLNFVVENYSALGLEGGLSDYNIATVTSLMFAGVVLMLPAFRDYQKEMLILWGLRYAVTLGLMLIYERFYVVLDAFTYFRIASGGVPRLEDLTNGTDNLIWGLAVLIDQIPLLKSYQSLKVVFSFTGLIGGFLFWRSYTIMTGEEDRRLIWILCGFPSILFWTSILGKDPIVFLGLGLFTLGATKLIKRPDFYALLQVCVGLLVVSLIRLWMGCCMALSLAVVYVTSIPALGRGAQFLKISVLVAAMFIMGLFVDRLRITSQEDLFGRINVVSRGWSVGGSQQEVPELNTLSEIVKFLPWGAFSSLFRPFPGEVNNIFGWLAGIENLILLYIAFLSAMNFRMRMLDDPNLKFLLLTIALWSIIYAFISFQNLGTAVRFKTQIMPFLLILPFYIGYIGRKDASQGRIFGNRPFREDS